MSIAEKHKLYVVEDAAQALGSRFKGQHADFGIVKHRAFIRKKSRML